MTGEVWKPNTETPASSEEVKERPPLSWIWLQDSMFENMEGKWYYYRRGYGRKVYFGKARIITYEDGRKRITFETPTGATSAHYGTYDCKVAGPLQAPPRL
jgi:hypothetical protein